MCAYRFFLLSLFCFSLGTVQAESPEPRIDRATEDMEVLPYSLRQDVRLQIQGNERQLPVLYVLQDLIQDVLREARQPRLAPQHNPLLQHTLLMSLKDDNPQPPIHVNLTLQAFDATPDQACAAVFFYDPLHPDFFKTAVRVYLGDKLGLIFPEATLPPPVPAR